MFLHLSVILFTGRGGVYPPPGQTPSPPGTHLLPRADTYHPPGRHLPPQGDTPRQTHTQADTFPPGHTPSPPPPGHTPTTPPPGRHLPPGRHPQADPRQTHTHPGRHPLPQTATAVDGTYPTGMHSCFYFFPKKRRNISFT